VINVRTHRHFGRKLSLFLLILALPLLCFTLNIRWALNDLTLYTFGFEKYEISRHTGIGDRDLTNIASTIIEYWNSPDELIEVSLDHTPLFNEREVIHMKDVKGLVNGLYLVQWLALITFGCSIFIGFVLRTGNYPTRLAYMLGISGLISTGVIILLSIVLSIGFPWAFYVFHIISFSNDYWQLDPQKDYLVRLFPQGFWFDATMAIVLATFVQCLLFAALGWVVQRILRWQTKGQQSQE